MKDFFDHFEIESQRPGETWEHIGNVYPEYEWKICRPWYFLGLIKRPVITNEVAAWTATFDRVVKMLEASPESNKRRLTVWIRGRFQRLRRIGALEQ